MKDKKDNKENQNNDSSHPEMNEGPIEVSKEVPNTVEELLEIQNKFNIEYIEIDDFGNQDLLRGIIKKRKDKVEKTIREILKIDFT